MHLHETNIGTNAKHFAAEMCTGDFIIGLDDDVTDIPEDTVIRLLEAYINIPSMGYLSTDVVRDSKTNGAKPPEDMYFEIPYFDNRFVLQAGPAGGWMFVVSRKVYNSIGKFATDNERLFTGEDGNYTMRVIEKGLRTGVLKGVKVYHATDPENNKPYREVYTGKMKELKILEERSVITKAIDFVRHSRYFYHKFIELLEREALGKDSI